MSTGIEDDSIIVLRHHVVHLATNWAFCDGFAMALDALALVNACVFDGAIHTSLVCTSVQAAQNVIRKANGTLRWLLVHDY